MKKLVLSLMLSIFTLSICFSQDTITLKTSDDIKAKVLEVTPTGIKYKRFDNLDGPTFTALLSDIIMIRYENGTRGIFNVAQNNVEQEKKSDPSASLTGAELYFKGQIDAERYYSDYKVAGTGTLIASLLSPLVGLVPAIACSATKPKEANLNYQDLELAKKPDYLQGYSKKAKRIKQGKVWTNWGIGLGVNLFLVIALASG